ncbi:MAG: Gx transporter family protein [Erysipelotrichaceae bacterium]|nr:Gx transporter family protein [Erysipelotrichaceae bacterium]MDY5252633.1 Gx transporter family protein [Erysipelotrichaceae bacterium]
MRTKRFVYLTLLSAMAITLNILESILIGPIFLNLRIGLANIIALITLLMLGPKDMLIVNMMRVFIGNLLRGLIFGTTFWISLSGVVLSSIVLLICYRLKSSIVFTSILSSVGHSVGQVLMVMFIYQQAGMAITLPYLLIFSIPTGILTGFVAKAALSRVHANLKVR